MQSVADVEIVDWIGRLGAASVEHVAARFGLEQDDVRERLSCLQQDGLLGYTQRRDDHRVLYWASTRGLSRCGLDRLDLWQSNPLGFDDALRIAQVAAELARGLPDWQVLSAREIAAIEAASGEPYASARVSQDGRWTTHLPALVLSSPLARVIPVEVQPRLGTVSSLLAVCRGWARARHVSRVYWLAQHRPGLAVRRAVREALATDRVMVLGLDDVPLLVAREEAIDALP